MTTSPTMNATIYEFPTEQVRAKAAAARARTVRELNPGYNRVVVGSCWYHDDAVNEARKDD